MDDKSFESVAQLKYFGKDLKISKFCSGIN
jgi:hypothetical protein